MTASAPNAVFRLPSGSWVLQWQTDAYVAELLLCEFLFKHLREWQAEHPEIPPQQVEGNGAMWRVKARANMGELVLRCGFEAAYSWMAGKNDADQYFLGGMWWDENCRVAIGTKDEDALDNLAERGQGLPTRWAGLIHYEDVKCEPDGIEAHLAQLLADEN